MRTLSALAILAFLVAAPASWAQPAGEDPIYTPGDGVTHPKAIKEVKPQYTADAYRAKIQGTVALECVVEKNGGVGEVKVVKSLDPGLDEEAVKALKQWRFEPGRKEGKPVRVRVELEMTFTLR